MLEEEHLAPAAGEAGRELDSHCVANLDIRVLLEVVVPGKELGGIEVRTIGVGHHRHKMIPGVNGQGIRGHNGRESLTLLTFQTCSRKVVLPLPDAPTHTERTMLATVK